MKWLLIAVSLLHLTHFAIGDDCFCALCELDKLPDNCTTIYGHIQIGLESTMPPFEIVEYKLENVTKIVGCVTIANSGFTSLSLLSNLKVLQYSQTGNATTCSSYGNIITIARNSLLRRLYFSSLKEVIVGKKAEYGIYIVENPSLCITEEELEAFVKTDKFYAPHIQICDPKRVYCRLDSFEFFDETNIAPGCQVLTDSLVLNGTQNENTTEFQSRLNDIEQILGSIIVLQTDIVSLKFPKLWRIYNFQPDLPIILLQYNEFLSEVELVNLTSVPFFGTWPDVLFAFHNPLFTKMSEETCDHLERLGDVTFEDTVKDICNNEPTTTMTTTTMTTTVMSVVVQTTAEIKAENTTGGRNGNISSTLNLIEKSKPPNEDTRDNSNCNFIGRPLLMVLLSLFTYLLRSCSVLLVCL